MLDDINLSIIKILSKDSSTPFVEIARRIGISDATVHGRIRRLVASGIINKFTLSVDNNLLGYDHLAFIGTNIEPGFEEEITAYLSHIDEVLEIHEMHGRDILENKIRAVAHVTETELMAVLKSRKEVQIVSLNLVFDMKNQ